MTTAQADAQSQPDVISRPVIVGLVLLASAVGLLTEALATSDDPTRAVIWGGLALAAYAWGLLCLVGSRQGLGLGLSSWKLGSWTLLWYGATFGLASVTWSQPQLGTASQIILTSVLRALWLVAVGLTAWGAGYLVGPGRPARGLAVRYVGTLGRRFTADVRSPLAPWLLYTVGIGARLAAAATTGLFGYVGDPSSAVTTASGYGEILSLLSLCAPLAVATAALQVYREKIPGSRITLYILFGTELAFGAAAGGKQSFVITVLAVLIPRTVARTKVPKAAVAAAIIAFLVLVIPFNQAYRNAARSSSGTLAPGVAVAEAPGILARTVTDQNSLTVAPDSFDYLLQRIREIDAPAIILQRTPSQIGYDSRAQLILGPLAGFVPRAIWPSKPILASGYRLNQEYYGLPKNLYTSSAVTPIGDLYRHGGWLSMIAGMFLLGCGVRLLEDILDLRGNPHAIFLVLLLFPAVVKGEQDWTGLLAGIPATILLWLLAVAITFRRRRMA
jgi:hypothetical protein